jgi:hypothetical protein
MYWLSFDTKVDKGLDFIV